MSEPADLDDEEILPQRSGRLRALAITGVALVLVVIALTIFAGIYTDGLWYHSAGYGEVFRTMLVTKLVMFVVFGLLMAGSVVANTIVAFRMRPFFRPPSNEQTNLDRYRDVVTPIRTWLIVALGVVVAIFAGSSGLGRWKLFLLWRHRQSFGSKDPYFNKDIGFYVFSLPWWHFLVDFAMVALVLSLIAAVVVHYLYGGIRLQADVERFSGPAQVQLSVLVGLFILLKAVDYYLDRFDLVEAKNSLFTGMDYTGDNAMLPAKNILIGVCLICAVLFFLNVWRRNWQLPSVGVALLAVSAVLLGIIWPTVLQQFSVKPSQADKEKQFISRNIAATRSAYDLTGITKTNFSPTTAFSPGLIQIGELLSQTSKTPLLDPQLVRGAFEQTQASKSYYTTPPVLDVDHYELGGTQRPLVLGARELNQADLPTEAKNWTNEHTVYTHGNGIIAAYADDQVSTSQEDSSDQSGIDWAQGVGSSSQSQNDLQTDVGPYDDRIYYGQNSPDYSIVGKASSSSPNVEDNLPTAGEDTGDKTTFTGHGDASLGSTFNRLMFSLKYGDQNIVLSGRVNANSKILFDRDPRQRVEKAAPWLTVDSDPYPAVVDGRIQWILDGYTTTDHYPGSQRESLSTMTSDALQVDNGIQQPLPTDQINYMRDAVKATVDAESGEVKLYAWDDTDPILRAWESAFPGSVLPKAQLLQNAQLLAHVRYPEDLFKVQRYQYARYHVTDPGDWYSNNDRWSVPFDPNVSGANIYQAPYRLFADDSGSDGTQTYSLTSTYVPFGRATLASYLSVDSDASSPDYGHLRVLDMPDENPPPGPGQVATNFAQSSAVQTALVPYTNGNSAVTVSYGNVLTVPIGDAFLNVEPVYTQRPATQTDASYPILTKVLVRYADQIAIGNTLPAALRSLFGGSSSGNPGTNQNPGTSQNPGTNQNHNSGNGGGGKDNSTASLQAQVGTTIIQLQRAFNQADAALAKGDLGTYQADVDRAQALFRRLVNLRSRIETASGQPSTSPSSGASSSPSSGASSTPASPAPSSSSTSPTPGAATTTSPSRPAN